MADALGFIETKGLVGAVAAADAMIKSADVTLVGKEITGPALVLIKIKGDLASVKYAVESGEIAAKNAGNFISSLVIAEPDSKLAAMLPEIYSEIKSDNYNLADNKEEHSENDRIITEQKPEELSETETSVIENNNDVTDESAGMQIEVIEDNTLEINKIEEELKEENDQVNDNPLIESRIEGNGQQDPERSKDSENGKKIKKINKRKKKTEGAEIIEKEEEAIISDSAEQAPADEQVTDAKYDAPDDGAPSIVSDNLSAEYTSAVAENENLNNNGTAKKGGKKAKVKPQETHATLFDSLFDSVEDAPFETDDKENEPVFNSTIERLKSEALGVQYEETIRAPVITKDDIEVQDETPHHIQQNSLVNDVQEAEPAPVKEEPANKEAVKEKKLSKKKNEQSNSDDKYKSNGSSEKDLSSDFTIDYLQTLNVHLLRKAARGVSGFPIQGREISKANRQVLLDYFSKLI